MKIKLLLLAASMLMLSGCGDDFKYTIGGVDTHSRCIDGYKFAIAHSGHGVALAQIMPPQECR